MTTYQEQIQKAVDGEVIPQFWMGYFREAFREEVNDALVELCGSADMSKAALSRKIGRRPEQVSRWLNSPSNLEIDTVSDFALAFGLRPVLKLEPIAFASEPEQETPIEALDMFDGNVIAVDFSPRIVSSSTAFASKLEIANNG